MKKNTIKFNDGTELELSEESYNKLYGKAKELKELTSYDEVANKLFNNSRIYYIDSDGEIGNTNYYDKSVRMEPNISKTEEQLESILALNKLCNVAKYLNNEWLPKSENGSMKYFIYLECNKNIKTFGKYFIDSNTIAQPSFVYFKSEELAKQAIGILGEETIKKALTLNH